MGAMASQLTILTIGYSTVHSGTDQRKQQISASLVFVRGIHRWPVNSPHKGPVTRKMFPFDDVILKLTWTTAKTPRHSTNSVHNFWDALDIKDVKWSFYIFSILEKGVYFVIFVANLSELFCCFWFVIRGSVQWLHTSAWTIEAIDGCVTLEASLPGHLCGFW